MSGETMMSEPPAGGEARTLADAASRPRPTRRLTVFAAAALLGGSLTGAAAEEKELCRQSLVFALDVSGSVNESEYRQQLEGLAGALQDPDVRDVILIADDEPLAIAAFEWSSADYTSLIVDWTFLRNEEDIAKVAHTLSTWKRQAAPRETSIGAGLKAAATLLRKGPQCWKMTIDISADGKNNNGLAPLLARQDPIFEETTVNALLVGTSGATATQVALEELERYLKENVVGGPGGFVAVAESYADYLHAMRRKLLNEIGAADPAPPGAAGQASTRG